jgi:hypothetical protein
VANRVGSASVFDVIAVEPAGESGNFLHFGCARWVCAAQIGEGEPMSEPGQPAVVCGERMAGLLTAPVLSDFSSTVAFG